MELLQKQFVFSFLQAKLTFELYSRGYKVTEGEWWRSPETNWLYAKEHKGIAHSLHTLRLARDLNLFKDARLLITVAEYKEAGDIWKGYSTDEYDCRWGGDFASPDVYHFSMEHQGVK